MVWTDTGDAGDALYQVFTAKQRFSDVELLFRTYHHAWPLPVGDRTLRIKPRKLYFCFQSVYGNRHRTLYPVSCTEFYFLRPDDKKDCAEVQRVSMDGMGCGGSDCHADSDACGRPPCR